MIKANVRRGDGLARGRPWLHSVVHSVQAALRSSGAAISPDGQFGRRTEMALSDYQAANGLEASGIARRETWHALREPLGEARGARDAFVASLLPRFCGDLDWVHALEGHRGRPYWPGGVSGVTLDPGVDLGHATPELVESLFGPLLSAADLRRLRPALGLRGADARSALRQLDGLDRIRISRQQALELMPHAARGYWNAVVRRFPVLSRVATPASVQTALLSLAYNRGALNRHLAVLGQPLSAGRWHEVADTVGAMQQGHQLAGIRLRRRREAALIRAELEFLGI